MTSTMYVLALTVTLIVLTNGADYCKLKSCNPASHTVCKYGVRISDFLFKIHRDFFFISYNVCFSYDFK